MSSTKQRSKSSGLLLAAFALCLHPTWSQLTIRHPFVHAKSHATVTLDSIHLSQARTILYLHLTNEVPNGWFCLSSDIQLRDSRGIQWHSIETKGLPTCPKRHIFRQIGQVHHFEIHFPGITTLEGPLHLYEQCPQHCLRLEGIVIDDALNRELYQLERALLQIRRGKDTAALETLLQLFHHSRYPHSEHILQCAYHLAQLYRKLKRAEKAHPYIQYLKSSEHPRAQFYVQKLQKHHPHSR